jgi:hypothetical protein
MNLLELIRRRKRKKKKNKNKAMTRSTESYKSVAKSLAWGDIMGLDPTDKLKLINQGVRNKIEGVALKETVAMERSCQEKCKELLNQIINDENANHEKLNLIRGVVSDDSSKKYTDRKTKNKKLDAVNAKK